MNGRHWEKVKHWHRHHQQSRCQECSTPVDPAVKPKGVGTLCAACDRKSLAAMVAAPRPPAGVS